MTKTIWRLIPLLNASGAVQMAIDRWLLLQHRQGKLPSILRFYTWFPPAISLGYHQKQYPTFWHDITWQGKPLDIIRRPTGGRAVLHQGDLTYMVVTSNIPPRLSYEYICQFLIQGWRSLGLNLEYGKLTRVEDYNCFATLTKADLVTPEGKKLIGSAQLRQGDAILQHGSMLIAPNQELYNLVFTELFHNLGNWRSRSPEQLINQVVASLIEAAQKSFRIELYTEPLSTKEWEEIHNLIQEKIFCQET